MYRLYVESQNANILVSNFGVSVEVSKLVEQLLASIPKKNKSLRRYILGLIKKSPPQVEQGVDVLRQEVDRQLGIEDISAGVPSETMDSINKTTDVKDYRKWLIKTFKEKLWSAEDLPGIRSCWRP